MQVAAAATEATESLPCTMLRLFCLSRSLAAAAAALAVPGVNMFRKTFSLFSHASPS